MYLALVVLGPSPAKRIEDFTGISKEEVYRKVFELEKKGVVKRTFSRPVIYEAVSLESTSNTMLKLKAEKLSNIAEKTIKMLEMFEEKRKSEIVQAHNAEIKFIPPKRALEELVKKELKNVTTSLDTICPWEKGSDWLSCHKENFIDCLKRNVQIRVIIEQSDEDYTSPLLLELRNYSKFQCRTVRKLPPTCLGLYDQKRVIIDTTTRSNFIETPCIWSDNSSIVGMAQIYFETIWKETQNT